MKKNNQAFDQQNATRIITTVIGVIFGLSGINHGFFEFLQGNTPTGSLVIQAIGPGQRFWPQGTEEAFTIIPNYMLSGILSMAIGLIIMIWSLYFLETRYGSTIFLTLFILLFLVGGGIGQLAFFIPAWAFSTQMNTSMEGWKQRLPQKSWSFLSSLWPITLTMSTVSILIGIELAIFGYFPGLTEASAIQNTAMYFVLSSILLNIFTYIAGFAHDLRRMYPSLSR